MSRITRKKPSARSTAITTRPKPVSPALALKRAPLWRSPWVLTVVAFAVAAVALAVFLHSSPPDTGPMVWVPGGTFTMGSEENRFLDCDATECCGLNDAIPLHTVEVSGFWMDETPVTNAQFARFVEATGYVTVAEKPMAPWPPGSFVFRPPPGITDLKNHRRWWHFEPGANWRHPDGPESDIEGKDDLPVVQVCYEDALEYAKWAGKRLPTEAEFEYAARGGLHQKRYVWGDELTPDGQWKANIWQGKFPYENTRADGFVTTSPVRHYAANGYGLYDMSGNVWQWCADWYRPDYYENSPRLDPKGPVDSFDPSEKGVPKRVQRGGSFLCSDLYCKGYLPGARGKGQPNSAANHIGFRCVRSAE